MPGGEYRTFAYESLTVSNAVKILTAATHSPSGEQAARRAIVRVLTDSVRYRFDGTDPVAGNGGGMIAYADEIIEINGPADIASVEFIRETTDATLEVLYER